jgi:hypothetical protein
VEGWVGGGEAPPEADLGNERPIHQAGEGGSQGTSSSWAWAANCLLGFLRLFCFAMLEIHPRVPCRVSKCSTLKPYPQPGLGHGWDREKEGVLNFALACLR